jgi:hypothetical protein
VDLDLRFEIPLSPSLGPPLLATPIGYAAGAHAIAACENFLASHGTFAAP